MGYIKKYLPRFLILVLLMLIVMGLRSFLMTNIIEPIAFFFWAIWRLLASVNQGVYWLILIGVSSILVIRLVPFGKDNPPRLAYSYRYRSSSRVRYWKKLLSDAPLGKQETEHLRNGLKALFASAIAQSHRFVVEEIDENAVIKALPLSKRAKEFLLPPKRGMLDLTALSPSWFRRWAGKLIQHDTRAIDEILSYLETEMEISHDR